MASARLVDPETEELERKAMIGEAVRLIREGKSVILYSALGPGDAQITATKKSEISWIATWYGG